MADPEMRERVADDGDVTELERRIALLEELDESAAGRFTRWDWAACVLGAVIVPCLVLWCAVR